MRLTLNAIPEGAPSYNALDTAKRAVDNPLHGRYRISMWYGGLPEGAIASDVPVTVVTRAGRKNMHLDQTLRTGEWRELGIFEHPLNVSLTNAANGRVIVDAIRFERID